MQTLAELDILFLRINKTDFQHITQEYNNQCRINLKYWRMLKKQGLELNEIMITSMITEKADFWLTVENLNPYQQQGKIMLSMSFNYIGTNKFYGYVSTEFYNRLIELFTLEKVPF